MFIQINKFNKKFKDNFLEKKKMEIFYSKIYLIKEEIKNKLNLKEKFLIFLKILIYFNI